MTGEEFKRLLDLQKLMYDRCLHERTELAVKCDLLWSLLKDTNATLDAVLSEGTLPVDMQKLVAGLQQRVTDTLKNDVW